MPPRILLLTSLDPLAMHGGTVLQEELLRLYPPGLIAGYSLVNNPTADRPSQLSGQLMQYRPLPPEQVKWNRFGRVARRLNLPLQMRVCMRDVASLVEEAVAVGRRHRAEIVWAYVQRPALIYMVRAVVRQLELPLIASVTDPPERFTRELSMGPRALGFVMKRFDEVVRNAARLSVASEGMAEEYARRYGSHDAQIFIHGVSKEQRRPPAERLNDTERFVIGMGGSVYALAEWRALLAALKSADWRIAGREVTVKVLGGIGAPQANGRLNIELLGWRPVDDAIDILSRCDVNYLPYWFDPVFTPSVRMCFPNKLSAYMAAGRPVLYHGPKDSTPTRFLQRRPAGLGVHSLDAKEIIAALERFATDPGFYASAAKAASQAAAEELNLETLRHRFARFIGISEDELNNRTALKEHAIAR